MIMTAEAPIDCPLCPRLADFRRNNARAHPDWFNGAVPSFGGSGARLLIVGLAPGLSGANRTGRPFTGDFAGDLLYATIADYGFSHGHYNKSAGDGLILDDCMITNAVRCVPPKNKPVGAEVKTCGAFLRDRIRAMDDLRIILALGRIAHDATLSALGERRSAHKFRHRARHDIGELTLIDSYHCSRYNTNTRRLTAQMFADVFRDIRDFLDDC